MTDTIQDVIWSLERPCRFRAGQDWFLPGKTFAQLHDLETVSEGALGEIVDGICITSYGFSNPELEASGILERESMRSLPYCGFHVEERLAKYGGLAEAKKVCGECEANAHRGSPIEVAGCCGSLLFDPDSSELDELLLSVIMERNLDGPFRAAFQVTTPLWYGFWIDSPLRRPQTALLEEIFKYAFADEAARDSELLHFCAALKAAVSWNLPIHVWLRQAGQPSFRIAPVVTRERPSSHFGSITRRPHIRATFAATNSSRMTITA